METKLDRITTFKNLEQALKRVENDDYNAAFRGNNSYRASMDAERHDFTQTKSLEESIDLCRRGWTQGRKIITALTLEHQDAFIKLFPKQDWAIQLNPELAGETVNMDAVLTGQPETMLQFQHDSEKLQKLQNGKMQRIIISGEFHCGINADTIFNRGSIVAAMINTMELSGFRTELYLVHSRNSCRNTDIRLSYYYKLKEFDENLDLNILSFACCHPSMLRRIQFALVEQEPEDYIVPMFCRSGYGYPCDIRNEEIEKFGGQINNQGNIYFEKLDYNKDFMTLLNDTKLKIEKHFTTIKI